MDMRYPVHPQDAATMTTEELRHHFHITGMFQPDQIHMVYTHIDRVIVGGILPVNAPLDLAVDPKEIGAAYFLERRELGIINIGEPGVVTIDGTAYRLNREDALYVGQGAQQLQFASLDANAPARFYFASTPAHKHCPTQIIPPAEASPMPLGDLAHSNTRTIYKYIHTDGVKSCQLVMGLTRLDPNNMWNTMPAHTHARRMEVYFYFDLQGDNVVFHLMGEPHETRHLVIRNEEAVISPSWSIHSGVGTGNYAFIWAMAGENQTFSDMVAVAMSDLL